MNKLQFRRLQNAVQFAVDDAKVDLEIRLGRYHWNQATWGEGGLTSEVVKDDANQMTWGVVCPTAGCLAGTIVTSFGDKMVVPADADSIKVGQGTRVTAEYCVDKRGNIKEIADRAQELIGVDDVGDLFGADNNAAQLVEMASELAEAYGYDLVIDDHEPAIA